ncbi:MAG: PAAR domain-containing protein [Terriglobales bacterium]
MTRARGLGRMGDRWVGQMHDGTPVEGVALSGSTNVRINGRPAMRVGDVGVVATPQGPRIWRATMGAATVRANGVALHRQGDLSVAVGAHGRLEATVVDQSDGVPTDAGAAKVERVTVWKVVATKAYVRNPKQWVLGVVRHGDLIVPTRVTSNGRFVEGRATVAGQGFKGLGRIFIRDKHHQTVLLRVRVPADKARLGPEEPGPRIVQVFRYIHRSFRGVRTRVLGDSPIYATWELTGEPLGVLSHATTREVEIRYVTKHAAMIRDPSEDTWGFVRRESIQLPPPFEQNDPYLVK